MPILSTFSIKPAGLKLSVFWHYIDESSLKTPPGHKKPFTAACHADIKNHLRPHGLLKVKSPFINFVKKIVKFSVRYVIIRGTHN